MLLAALAPFALVVSCGSSSDEEWTAEGREDARTELVEHCASAFPDDAGGEEFCNGLTSEALNAAEDADICGLGEAVEAIKIGIPTDSDDAAADLLRCLG